MNIKEKIQDFFHSWINTYKTYPITLTVIYLLTLFSSVVLDSMITESKLFRVLEDILLPLYVSAAVLILITFLVEIICKKKIHKFLFSILGFLVSLAFFILLYKEVGNEYYFLYRLIVCCCICLVCFILYFLTKKSKLSSEKYLVYVVQNHIIMAFIYGIVANGLIYVVLLFTFLIIGNAEHGIFASEILLFGFFYAPEYIRIITRLGVKEDKTYRLTEIVSKYILKGIVITAFAIIYIYMAKILITWKIPSNEIYRILASLFVVGCPIWTMSNVFTEKRSKLPLFFIPFVFLEIFSLVMRVYYNGLTPVRYLGFVLIVLEIVYIILYCFKKEQISKILFVMAIATVCSTIVPFINFYDLSIAAQEKNIKVYLEKDNLSEVEKGRVYSAYDYLSSEEGNSSYKSYKFDIISNEDKKVISSWGGYTSTAKDVEYVDLVNKKDIRVDGYKNIYEVSIYSVEEGLKVYYGSEDKYNFVISDDFMKAVRVYADNRLDNNDYNYYVIEINDKLTLVWGSLSFRYDTRTSEMLDTYIHGYVLSK